MALATAFAHRKCVALARRDATAGTGAQEARVAAILSCGETASLSCGGSQSTTASMTYSSSSRG